MTEVEAMDQYDRLHAAGIFVPADPDGKTGAVFGEWFNSLRGYAVDDVSEGLTTILRTKTDRSYPTLGQIRGAIASVTAGREKRGCANCGGMGWVEARPYRANGGHLYEGVTRCPACAVPVPRQESAGQQTPLSDAEYRTWQASKAPTRAITSRAEMLTVLHQFAARAGTRKPMPAVASWHDPREVE